MTKTNKQTKNTIRGHIIEKQKGSQQHQQRKKIIVIRQLRSLDI